MASGTSATAASADGVAAPIKHVLPLHAEDTLLLQHQHALTKLQTMIVQTKAMLIKVRNNSARAPVVIPLVHFIVSLTGSALDLQPEEKKKMLVSLSKLKPLIRTESKTLRLDTTEYDSDTLDIVGTYTTDAPYRVILEQLIEVLESVVSDLKRKVQHIGIQRDQLKLEKLDIGAFKDFITPVELQSMSQYVITSETISTYQFQKTPIFLKSMDTAFAQLQSFNTKLQTYKSRPTDGTMKKLPHWELTLHRITMTYVAILDHYYILRRFGRALYYPNSADLRNPKVLYANKNLEALLDKCEDLFIKPEKIGPLVSQLSKLTRNGSIIEPTHETSINLIKVVTIGVNQVSELLTTLHEFLKAWQPLDPILKRIAKTKESDKDSAKASSSPSPQTTPISNSPIFFKPLDNNRKDIELREKTTRDKSNESHSLPKISSPSTSRQTSTITRHRSDSNASVESSTSSLNSSTLSLNSLRNQSSPNASRITSPSSNSPNVSRTPSIQSRRPRSYYQSSPAFDIRSELKRQERAAALKTSNNAVKSPRPSPSPSPLPSTPNPQTSNTIQTRRRSSSLQSQQLPSNSRQLPVSAAATAISMNGTIVGDLKQKRASSLTSRTESPLSRRYYNDLGVPQIESSPRSPSPLRSLDRGLQDIAEKSDDTPTKRVPMVRNNPSGGVQRQSSITARKQQRKQKSDQPVGSFNELKQNRSSIAPPKPNLQLQTHQDKVTSESPASPSSPLRSAMKATTSFTPISHASPQNKVNESVAETRFEDTTIDSTKTLDPSQNSVTNNDAQVTNDSPNVSNLEDDIKNLSVDDTIDDMVSSPISTKDLTTTKEPEKAKPIVKKVRFIGVPPDPPESKTPRLKKFFHPLQRPILSPTPGRKSSLTVAAETLKQERLTFHNIRRGELDVKTGKVHMPMDGPSANRMMGSLAGVGEGIGPSDKRSGGKWGSFRDRFS